MSKRTPGPRTQVPYTNLPPFDAEDHAQPDGFLTWGRVARLIGEMGLREMNAHRETPDEWPAGQEWDELVHSSHWACVRHGLDLALAAPKLLAACKVALAVCESDAEVYHRVAPGGIAFGFFLSEVIAKAEGKEGGE